MGRYDGSLAPRGVTNAGGPASSDTSTAHTSTAHRSRAGADTPGDTLDEAESILADVEGPEALAEIRRIAALKKKF